MCLNTKALQNWKIFGNPYRYETGIGPKLPETRNRKINILSNCQNNPKITENKIVKIQDHNQVCILNINRLVSVWKCILKVKIEWRSMLKCAKIWASLFKLDKLCLTMYRVRQAKWEWTLECSSDNKKHVLLKSINHSNGDHLWEFDQN
jgi:hypothetical protein